jgi:amino acid adenylation domain-containing protein
MSALVQDYIRRQADLRPDAVAVALDDEQLTYGALDGMTSRLASLLREAGCREGDRVGVLIEKSPAAVVGMIAALKARCAYVPMDVASPSPRLARILASADPRVVLISEHAPAAQLDALLDSGALGVQTQLGALGSPQAWPVAFDARDLDAAAEWHGQGGRPDDVAYLLFTSGSTGVPKGVMIAHRSVRAFADWMTERFAVSTDDRCSGHAQFHFDLSTLDLYTAFAAGAELHLVPDRLSSDARALASFIRDRRLTQWVSVPSVLSYVTQVGALELDAFPDLRRVLWCGDVLPASVLAAWKARLPHVEFTNLYGPTEATVASTFHVVAEPPPGGAPIPIGRACAGEEVFVADERLEPVPAGEVGEICIAGVGLALGYWRDEETTRRAFVPNPRRPAERIYRTGDLGRVDDAGVLHFLGRRDSQVKHRGYRIELGEIEAALDTIDGLAECAVVGVATRGFEATVICCAYATSPDHDLTPAAVRRAVGRLLPGYMVPTRWLQLDELPKNSNGKIDRNRVRELVDSARSGERPPAVTRPAEDRP